MLDGDTPGAYVLSEENCPHVRDMHTEWRRTYGVSVFYSRGVCSVPCRGILLKGEAAGNGAGLSRDAFQGEQLPACSQALCDNIKEHHVDVE